MPEGDTLRKVAAALVPRLVGERLEGVWTRDPAARGAPLREAPDLAGHAVESVEAVGKHLLVRVGGAVLRVHLGLTGSFHRYAPDEPWQKPRARAGLVLRTATSEVVCFDPKAVERARADRPIAALARLGPDLMADEVDQAEIVRRARAATPDDGTIGTLLLDQTVSAGIGNVFKSEVLFLGSIHPWTPRETLEDVALEALYRRARDLLLANARPGGRRTVPRSRAARPVGSHDGGPRLWVYGRGGTPCLRCGATVERRLQGRHARVTFWCPTCQPRP